ncbi:putative ferric-chelate reductase 1 [Xyrichtys novacula]|uniref:Ferric-chelate reductase 1 n=1 Tax=Xyrichtys novacula TaxID=13765 RepID=A0AAV1GGR6_XYRNO|nr:putative ferric-chelate reductase 1 [Xyrichtys novacula]
MERGLILLVAATLMVYMAPGVRGTAHLSFSNDTEVNITRDGCGVTKLCEETPADCDPSSTGTCLFASVVTSPPVAPDGSNLAMELRGDSMGYVALGLTLNASEGTTMLFICAQNSSDNGTFFFRTMQRNNTDGMLTPIERRVRDIRGMVNGSIIKCEFVVPNANATSMRNAATTFSILLGTGTFTGNMIGDFNVRLDSGLLNLADPTSNIATTAAPSNMTTAPSNMTTASGSNGGVQPHAVLLVLSVLSLPVMLRG